MQCGLFLTAIWTILLLHNGVQLSKVLGTRQPGYLDFDNLPETNFTCEGKVIGGYYADIETGCQMFHVCTIGQKGDMTDIKFLCLNGTVFDQETRVCERVDEVDCSKSGDFYDLNLELYNNGFVLPEDERRGDASKSDETRESEEVYDDGYDADTEEPPATTKGLKTSVAAPNPTPATTAVTTTSKSNLFGTVKPTYGILIPESKNKNAGAQIIELHQHSFGPKSGPIQVVVPNKQAGTLVRGSVPVQVNYQRPAPNKPQPPLESKNVGTHLTGLVPAKNLHTPRPYGFVTALPYGEGQFHKMHHLDTSLKPPPSNFKPFAETTSYKPSSYDNYKNHFFPSSSPGPIDSILINFNQKHQDIQEIRSSSQSKRPVVVISHHFPTLTPGKSNYNGHPGFAPSPATSAPPLRHGHQQQPGPTVKLQHHSYQHKPNPTILALQSQQKKVHQLHQEGLEIAEHQIAQIASRNAEISNLRSQKTNDRKDDFGTGANLREAKEASPLLKPSIAIVTSTSSTSSRVQNKSVVSGLTAATPSSGGSAKPVAYNQETEYKSELEKLFAATEREKEEDAAEEVAEEDSDMDLEQLLLAWKLKTNQEVTKEDIERVFSSLDTSKFKNGQTISLSDIFEITKNVSEEETTRVPPMNYDDYTEEDVPYDPFYKDVPKVQNELKRARRASPETIKVKVLDNGGFVGRELGKAGKNSGSGDGGGEKVFIANFRLVADGRKTRDAAQGWRNRGAATPAATPAKSSPETRFRCRGKVIGAFYADPEVDCRMFHLCAAAANGRATEGAPSGPPGSLPPQVGPDGEPIGGPRTPQQIAAQKRLQQTQAQVDEVVDIMKTNVEKVLERDQKLSELDDRADALQQGASQFEQQAGKLKRKFWLQNLKMMIIMGVIGLVILAIIVVKFMPDNQPPQQPIMYQQPMMPPQSPGTQEPAKGG